MEAMDEDGGDEIPINQEDCWEVRPTTSAMGL